MDIIFIYSCQNRQTPAGHSVTSTLATPAPVAGPTAKDLGKMYRQLWNENEALRQKIEDLRDEMQQLYLKYDLMAAAFGEMNYFIREASAVHSRHMQEEQP